MAGETECRESCAARDPGARGRASGADQGRSDPGAGEENDDGVDRGKDGKNGKVLYAGTAGGGARRNGRMARGAQRIQGAADRGAGKVRCAKCGGAVQGCDRHVGRAAKGERMAGAGRGRRDPSGVSGTRAGAWREPAAAAGGERFADGQDRAVPPEADESPRGIA